MSRALLKRMCRLELARRASIEAKKPVEPTAVYLAPLEGTPGAIESEAAFRAAHPGRVLVVQTVDARRQFGADQSWQGIGHGLVVPGPVPENVWDKEARHQQASLKGLTL